MAESSPALTTPTFKLFWDAQGQADVRNLLLAAELGKGELALAQKLHKYTFN